MYYEHCCELLEKHEIVQHQVRCSSECPLGTLRVSAPTWFANRFFADLLKSYSLQYPYVQLDVLLSDNRADLVEEALDVALRVTREPDPRQTARQIGTIQFCLAASREYLRTNGVPQTVADLARHEMITYAHYDGWIDLPPPERPTRWRLDNTTLIAHMALQGLGIAMLPDALIDQEPELVPVLTQPELPPAALLAVTQKGRKLSVRASSFIEHLAANFGAAAVPV